MTYQRIIRPERDTQNRAIDLLLSVLPKYRYIGNLEDVENSNIREEELHKFLTSQQGCNAQQADEAIRSLKQAAACSTYANLFDKNLATYKLLRNGEKVSQGYGIPNKQVQYIDWKNPLNNDFAIAEEVTVRRVTEDLKHRRPDIVIYVNGIALVVLELKKISVSVSDAIRQNRRNQKDGEILHFFTTTQLLLAGNESEGVKYGVIKTPEEFWLKWKEPTGGPYEPSQFTQADYPNEMMRSLLQMLNPNRLLEFIHDCIIFDGGIKKAARPNQYFALAAAKRRFVKKDSGIIWHSQGSGKSLTMIWLAQWIREQGNDARIVIVTDRDELDKQIENGFKNTGEQPFRVQSGEQLINTLNRSEHSIICTLIHKFGLGLHDDVDDQIIIGDRKSKLSAGEAMEKVTAALPPNFSPKGNIVVFVDECHRTQGGILHQAMRKIMGDNVMMIGFTGTPLLKENKNTSMEQFGSFIHTYKFDEAVDDHVILDLRYEARNVEQKIDESDNARIDRIFEAKTTNMTQRAKEALKTKWATLQSIYSSDERVKRIVRDICEDMILLPPLAQGYGNAMLVASDIYQAYKYWQCFESTDLKGKTAVISSYDPQNGVSITQGHSSDADNDEETFKCNMAKKMMGDKSAIQFEEWAKVEFVNYPNSMKLLIVVDKLLTGFDAPKATYLYIDKHMKDHNLFQAICRVNRVESDQKEFGYIIDYKDLFDEIAGAVEDYTNGQYTGGAFSAFNSEDVAGLLKSRLEQGKKDLDEALELIEGLCQYVKQPKAADQYFDYFVFDQATTPVEEQQAASLENATKREQFYNAVLKLTNRYLGIATQMDEAGYTAEDARGIHQKVTDYDELRKAIMLRSGDSTDLKQYNAMMRQLLDQYVQAPKSNVLEKLDDFSFLDIIDVHKTENDPDGINIIIDGENEVGGQPAAAEAIASNVRKYIIRKRDANPDYYDKLSEKLNKILGEMKQHTHEYKEQLRKLVEILREIRSSQKEYPSDINTDGKKALYDNLDNNEILALHTYFAIKEKAETGFREHRLRQKSLRKSIERVQGMPADKVEVVLNIAIYNPEF